MEREVAVTKHAVEQLRLRRPLVYGDLTERQISRVIRFEVAAAIDAGRIASEKPVAFRLHGHKKARLRGNQRVVWTAKATFAWIIAREDNADVVITTLTRARAA